MSFLHRKLFSALLRSVWADTCGVVAIEFAILALPCIFLILFVFEISFDLFQQEVMDSALHLAARQLQTGNAQNVKDGSAFITNYLCPGMAGLLSCNGLNVKVQKINPASNQDYYNFTTGGLPVNSGVLDLSSYGNASFCNSGPSQFLVISAIYIAPTIVGSLLPGMLSVLYNGSTVHATLSTVGVFSEGYSSVGISQGSAAAC